jgi:hypothetical protein
MLWSKIMLANTKQMREIVKAAADAVDANIWGKWTDKLQGLKADGPWRYVVFSIGGCREQRVAKEVRKRLAALGYDNDVRTTEGYVRTTAIMPRGGLNVDAPALPGSVKLCRATPARRGQYGY